MLLYVLFLVVLSVCNYEFGRGPNPGATDWFSSMEGERLVLVLLVLSVNLVFLVYEVFQMSMGVYEYVTELSNYFDIGSHGLVFTGSLMRLYYSVETVNSAAIMSVATIMLWVNLLYYLRPFKATSAVVRMLYVDTQEELKTFVLVLAFTLFGFSQALYLLDSQDGTYPFGAAEKSYVGAFAFMMGNSDLAHFDGSKHPHLGQLEVILLITVGAIFMLNLLTAILCKCT